VRQILVKNMGSTRHHLLSTQQLYCKLGLPRKRVVKLYKDGIISPKTEWKTGNHHYLLWSADVAEKVANYYYGHRLCKICLRPVGKGRWVFCSDDCYREGQKYKYKSKEAKRRHLKNIKGYLERRRNLAFTAVNT
jgi:predicted nucleic acid-binding Zn ribbon protein